MTLARALDPARYEVHFASARFDDLIFARDRASSVTRSGRCRRPWSTRASRAASASTAGARSPRYVREERALLQAVRPDLVVGDLRLSLAVSAPLERVPVRGAHQRLLELASPCARASRCPTTRSSEAAGRRAGRALLRAGPALRLPSLRAAGERAAPRVTVCRSSATLPEVLTFGDHTLFPDMPALVPTRALPAHQRYLGLRAVVAAGAAARLVGPPRRGAAHHLRHARLVGTCVSACRWCSTRRRSLGYQVLLATAGRSAWAAAAARLRRRLPARASWRRPSRRRW